MPEIKILKRQLDYGAIGKPLSKYAGHVGVLIEENVYELIPTGTSLFDKIDGPGRIRAGNIQEFQTNEKYGIDSSESIEVSEEKLRTIKSNIQDYQNNPISYNATENNCYHFIEKVTEIPLSDIYDKLHNPPTVEMVDENDNFIPDDIIEKDFKKIVFRNVVSDLGGMASSYSEYVGDLGDDYVEQIEKTVDGIFDQIKYGATSLTDYFGDVIRNFIENEEDEVENLLNDYENYEKEKIKEYYDNHDPEEYGTSRFDYEGSSGSDHRAAY